MCSLILVKLQGFTHFPFWTSFFLRNHIICLLTIFFNQYIIFKSLFLYSILSNLKNITDEVDIFNRPSHFYRSAPTKLLLLPWLLFFGWTVRTSLNNIYIYIYGIRITLLKYIHSPIYILLTCIWFPKFTGSVKILENLKSFMVLEI